VVVMADSLRAWWRPEGVMELQGNCSEPGGKDDGGRGTGDPTTPPSMEKACLIHLIFFNYRQWANLPLEICSFGVWTVEGLSQTLMEQS